MTKLATALFCAAASGFSIPSTALAQSGGWLDIREPLEWSKVCRSQGAVTACTADDEVAVFPGNALVRLRGQALHPAGIEDIAVSGARAIIARLPDGKVEFSYDFAARPGQNDIEIIVRAAQGEPDRYSFRLRVDAVAEGLSGAWKAPETMLLIAGMPDTARIVVAASGIEVPAHLLTWESSNPDAVLVDGAGVVYPQREGTARVTVTAPVLRQEHTIDMVVYPRLTDLRFMPRDSILTVVEGERFTIRADLHFSETRVLHNQVPKLTFDEGRLRAEPGGVFQAVLPGTGHIEGSIGHYTRRWRVNVVAPLVAIRQLGGYTALLGDSVVLTARLLSPDSILVTIPAGDIAWRSSDPSVLMIREGVAHGRGIGRAEIVASRSEASDAKTFFVLGDLLVGARIGRRDRIVTMSLSGSPVIALGPDSINASAPVLAPDGRHIVFVGQVGRRSRLFIMDADGTNERRLLTDQQGLIRTSTYDELTPSWAQDGNRIVFVSNRDGNYEVYHVRPDGTELTRLTVDSAPDLNPSSTGSYIAFDRGVGAGDSDIILGDLDGSSESVVQSVSAQSLARVKESKPVLVPGGNRLLFARGAPGLDPQAGETLVLYDLVARAVIRDLVAPQKNHEIIFAVSPEGDRIAYHQRAMWGRKNARVSIIDMHGQQLGSVVIPGVVDIMNLAWGGRPDRK
jgi:Tol biopolymer transport system component